MGFGMGRGLNKKETSYILFQLNVHEETSGLIDLSDPEFIRVRVRLERIGYDLHWRDLGVWEMRDK